MKVLIINSVCGVGSTGKICTQIADKYISKGHTCVVAYGRGNVSAPYKDIAKKIGSEFSVKFGVLHTRITDGHGFANKRATKKFLKWADEYNPDIVWLHNIHGYYINIEMLFNWIKSRPDMKVKWTLHDCWAFTGHCSHFSMVKCDKWKNGCNNCIQTAQYPSSFIRDNSFNNYTRKKEAFCGVDNMTLITPSNWLKGKVEQSFLSDYPIEVHYNEIDKNVFKPVLQNIKKQYGLENKIIVLGVSNVWNDRKGLNDFLKLSEMLSDDYKIILVGLNKKQIKKLPSSILGIERTDSAEELARFYSAADVFVNPSREETFGLTTVEALSCGCKAIVYKDTACEEIAKQFDGIVVNDTVEDIYNRIIDITNNHA